MRGSSALDVDKAVQSAKEAQKTWASLTGLERGKIMSRAGRIIKVLHIERTTYLMDCSCVKVNENLYLEKHMKCTNLYSFFVRKM